jgi:hypothetical protein
MKRILVVLALCSGCGSTPYAGIPTTSTDPVGTAPSPPAPCTPPADGAAPTLTELYARYFAKGTPGHCATAHCHANPGFDVWLCGDDKDACYAGMVQVGLVDPERPLTSLIGDTRRSPLSWVNTNGTMPFDATGAFQEGRDAVLAWVAACARND